MRVYFAYTDIVFEKLAVLIKLLVNFDNAAKFE